MKTEFTYEKNSNGTCTIFTVLTFEDGTVRRIKGQVANNEESAKAIIASYKIAR